MPIQSFSRRLSIGALLISSLGIAFEGHAAEPWPTRPVKLLVGFPAGSSPDFVARALADPLAKALGHPVIVENRPGASGNMAVGTVVHSTDQHSFAVVINGNMTVAKLLNPSTSYEPLVDLLPVTLICEAPLLLAGPPTLKPVDFIAQARRSGSGWNYGSPGVGTVGHLATEVFKAQAGIQPQHVPYPSYQRVAAALIAGEVQMSFVGLGAAMPLVEAGRLQAIGVTGARRSPLVPQIPTLGEVGLPPLEFQLWTGIAAPRGTPAPIVVRLARALGEISQSPALREQLRLHGYDAVGLGPDAFAARIRADYALLSNIIKTQGIRNE